jgi:hypothetical protein
MATVNFAAPLTITQNTAGIAGSCSLLSTTKQHNERWSKFNDQMPNNLFSMYENNPARNTNCARTDIPTAQLIWQPHCPIPTPNDHSSPI